MTKAHERLRAARLALGKSVPEIAFETGITPEELHDLESREDEVYMTISIEDLGRLCKTLGMTPQFLFGDSTQQNSGLLRLAAALRHYLRENSMTPERFSEEVGWEVGGFGDDPTVALGWNVDCLKAVATKLGIQWTAVLPE